MFRNLIILALFLPMIQCAPVHAGWTEDFEAAKAQAAREGKDLLVNFSGSDWCIWCQKLDEEVFSTDTFKNEIGKSFVLVSLDYPNQTPQDPEIKARNQKLAQDYAIEGYPTILLMDAQGRPFSRLGYQEGGPGPYLDTVNQALTKKKEAYQFLKDSESLSGQEKAKKLDQFYSLMDKAGSGASFSDLVDQIIDLDKGGELGNKYSIKKEFTVLSEGLTMEADFTTILKDLDALEMRAAAYPLLRQEILMLTAMIHYQIQNDREKTLETLKKAQALDPASSWGEQIATILTQI